MDSSAAGVFTIKTQSYISTPMIKLKVGVCSMIPNGGDHESSDFLAIRMPEPPEPVSHSPFLIHEKTAIPAAFSIILCGIFFVTLTGVCGSVASEGDGEGAS